MKTKTTTTRNQERPYVGQPCTVYGKECRIFAVHSMGTIDVQAINEDKAWRLTGLDFPEALPTYNDKEAQS